jgi:hypothetical protein
MTVDKALCLEVVDFAERWVSRWNAHDVQGILELVTEDITWQDPSIDGTARGLSESRRYIEGVFRAFPDIAWSMPSGLLTSVQGNGRVLAIGQPWTCSGTSLGPMDPPGFAPTGKAFKLEGFDFWELERTKGRLRHVVSHYDALEFARRVGLMPARGSGAERMLVRLQRLRSRFGRRGR